MGEIVFYCLVFIGGLAGIVLVIESVWLIIEYLDKRR